jgi:hypothetical protein
MELAMVVGHRPASLADVLVALAFGPWILAGYLWDRLTQRKPVKAKPKARKPRAKPKTLTAAELRKVKGVSPGLRIIKGDIVWIHPACDAFMQGDLCGVVAIVGRKWITVRMTRSNRKLKFSPDLLAIDSIY